jgi:hypothetical protein
MPHRRALLTGTLAAVVCLLAGCYQPVDLETTFDQAHAKAKAGDWKGAMADAKALLIDHPDSTTGHFLLGQCYLYGENTNITHAQGELRMAWELFRPERRYEPWEDDMTWEEYEVRIHTVMAAMQMRWVSEALRAGIPWNTVKVRIINELRPHVRRSLKLDPENAFMLELEKTVGDMLKQGPAPGARPNLNEPSPQV